MTCIYIIVISRSLIMAYVVLIVSITNKITLCNKLHVSCKYVVSLPTLWRGSNGLQKFENHCAVAVPECNDTDVRLVHGTSPREGVVEICFGGRWGSVCNRAWDKADAAVVCGQLGFSREGEARIYSSTFTSRIQNLKAGTYWE